VTGELWAVFNLQRNHPPTLEGDLQVGKGPQQCNTVPKPECRRLHAPLAVVCLACDPATWSSKNTQRYDVVLCVFTDAQAQVFKVACWSAVTAPSRTTGVNTEFD